MTDEEVSGYYLNSFSTDEECMTRLENILAALGEEDTDAPAEVSAVCDVTYVLWRLLKKGANSEETSGCGSTLRLPNGVGWAVLLLAFTIIASALGFTLWAALI